jgi:acyl-CoA thioester hydrolase
MNSSAEPLPSAEIFVDVPFHDIDLMGVAWHGHYAKYCELARCALLDKFSYNYAEMKESGFAWPVTELKLRYIQPARLGQKIKVVATLQEFELRLKISYLIVDADSGTRISKGHTIQVPVDMTSGEMVFGAPPVLYRKLGIER